MSKWIFITGNQHKVDYLRQWLGIDVEHQKVDLDEIQSLDLCEVVEHKAHQAYKIVRKPVLVEDVSLTFEAMGRLPGTLIKWFLQEIGTDGLADMATHLKHRRATARIMYGYYDGQQLYTFDGEATGTIAPKPRFVVASGWHDASSWNSIFIPKGSKKTYAEMTDDELRPFSHRAKAIEKLNRFLLER